MGKISSFDISIAFASLVSRVNAGGIINNEDAHFTQQLMKILVESYTIDEEQTITRNHSAYPGYIIIPSRGKIVYIPIHLIEFFPSGEYLDYLVDLANEICVDEKHTICISGSTAAGVEATADIDFCEYVLHTGHRIAHSFIDNYVQNYSTCVKVEHAGLEIDGEQAKDLDALSGLCLTDSSQIAGKCECDTSHWMFDYVSKGFNQGHIPVTNRCILEEEAASKSWHYQEAAIGGEYQPVGDLTNPTNLAAYLSWLKDDATKQLTHQNPVKALKRAYSLTKILFRTNLSNKVRRVLNSKIAKKYCLHEGYSEADKWLENCTSRSSKKLKQNLKAPTIPNSSEIKQLHNRAEELVKEVLVDYELLLKRASEI